MLLAARLINALHPFYTQVHDPTPEVKAALEVLLFVLAEGELAYVEPDMRNGRKMK